MQGETTLKSAI